jgi:plastocyanin
MKKTIFLLLLVIGTLSLGGCSLYGGTQNRTTAIPAPTQVAPGEANTVNIQNFAFAPETLTVKKGATVTWTNNDSAPHQIKSDTFNSDRLSGGQSFSFTFNDAGTFDYICSIHPSMKGKIIVE